MYYSSSLGSKAKLKKYGTLDTPRHEVLNSPTLSWVGEDEDHLQEDHGLMW